MAEDVLDQLSAAIGRPVKPVGEQPKPAQTQSSPTTDHLGNSDPGALEKAIGRKVEPAKVKPLVSSRLLVYSNAMKNGMAPDVAAKSAMAEAVGLEAAPDPSTWQKIGSALGRVPTGTGKTFGDVANDAGDVVHRLWSNPMGVSDADWEKNQKKFNDFVDEKHKEFGSGPLSDVAAGAYKGLFKFSGEQMSPGQLALLMGTFGESALVRGASKLGFEAAPKVASTLSKLMQVQFGASMVEGATQGAEQTIDAMKTGNWEAAGQSAISGLISGVMGKGLMTHEAATEKVRGDLEKTAREKFGVPDGNAAISAVTSRFQQLNPLQQGEVIHAAVEGSPQYKAVVDAQRGQDEKLKKETQHQLTDYHDHALGQAFDPNAARRAAQMVDEHRKATAEKEHADGLEKSRQVYLRQITETLKAATQRGQAGQTEADAAEESQRAVERGERPAARAAAAEQRQAQVANANQIRGAREAAAKARDEYATRQRQTGDQRAAEASADEGGHVSYNATYFGEQNSFGVAGGADRVGVYRQTPRGIEYLDSGGFYAESPDSLYVAPDHETADTLAQLSSLRFSAEGRAEEDPSEANKAEARLLAQLEREIASGDKTAADARKEANLTDKAELPTELDAARDGKLNGPLADHSPAEYRVELENEADRMGFSQAEKEAFVQESHLAARAQVENNLHYVAKSGDYITSKKGVTWTLDSKGMLHPDDGASPIPLMKNGRYSAQSLDLATSGNVGFGQRSREQRRAETAKQRAAAARSESMKQEISDAVDFAVKQGQQQQGLDLATEAEPRADIEEKSARAQRRMDRPPSPKSTTRAAIKNIVEQVLASPANADGVIQAIAKDTGTTPEEVIRQNVIRSDTPAGKVAGLEPGDKIIDPFRKDKPWVVEEKNGQMQLRSGNAAPLPLDRINPSKRILQLAADGEIQSIKPAYTDNDVRTIAFESPHAVYVDRMVAEVKAIEAKELVIPDPKTPQQALAEGKAAARRTRAARSKATIAQVEALNPTTSSLPEAEAKADEATEAIKTAGIAYAQEAEAKSKVIPAKDAFPERAPISIGLKGDSGIISQNGRDFNFHYEMVPLESLVTSHTWRGNQQILNPEYTQELQPRTISESEAMQNAMRARPATMDENGTRIGYNFAEYGDKTINGAMGPAIIEPGGRVVGGNTRIGIMRRHLDFLREIQDPIEREVEQMRFREKMNGLARETGIEPRAVDSDRVVVRVLDEPIETLQKAAEMGRLFNKSISVEMTAEAQGVSFSKAMTDQDMSKVGRLIDESDGLGAAILAHQDYFRDLVINRFGIVPSEYAGWFTNDAARGLILNDRGRDRFIKAVMGTVIRDSSVLDAIEGKAPYRAIERALPYMVRIRGIDEKNISGKILEAVSAAADTADTDPNLHSKKDRWLATYQPEQADFLGMESSKPDEPDRITEALWRAMHAGPRTLSDRLKNFIGDDSAVEMAMFQSHETPADAFNRVFRRELTETSFSRGDKRTEITQDEYDRALRNVPVSDEEHNNPETKLANPTEGVGGATEHRAGAQAPTRYKFGNSQSVIEKGTEAHTAILAAQKKIADADLAGDGKDIDEPHVTVRYGIRGDDTSGIEKFIRTQKPFEAQLGKTDIFPPSPSSDGAAVVVAPVESEELHRLNGEIQKHGSFEPSSFPDYKPHATVAYVKPEAASKYVGMTDTEGKKFRIESVDISDRNGKKTTVKLQGQKPGRMSPLPEPPAKAPEATPEGTLSAQKEEQGYVTPQQLRTFLEYHPSTRDHVPEIMRTARMMAQYVFDADPPEGVDRNEALGWVLQNRIAKLEMGEKPKGRGSFTYAKGEEMFGKGILALHKAADPTTFIHEFAHVIFPMLSEEDMLAINSLEGDKKYEKWDGSRKGLTGQAFQGVSEKFAGGLERFLRDENPTGFTSEVKSILAKVKNMFREAYLKFAGDPLSNFALTEEARGVFADMFQISDFDVADVWRDELKKARAEEKKWKKPEDQPHPLVKMAQDHGATGLKTQFAGKVEDTVGDRVDPKKPVAVLTFPNAETAATAWMDVGTPESKIKGGELVASEDGTYGIRFNTERKVPPEVLYQPLPPKHPGIELEETKKKLERLGPAQPLMRRVLEAKVQKLESDIRTRFGAEPEQSAAGETPTAQQVIKEIKDVRNNKAVSGTRGLPSNVRGLPETGARDLFGRGAREVPKLPKLGLPDDAKSGSATKSANGPLPGTATLKEVRAVDLQPLPDRGPAVGLLDGQKFDGKAWSESLGKAGLPANMPPPTVTLDRTTSEMLKYAGQKQIVQGAMSAFKDGDGYVIASSTGTGKTYTAGGVINEFLRDNPEAKVLYITKNQGLLRGAETVGKESFGYNMSRKALDAAPTGVHGATYQGIIGNRAYRDAKWDLVVADEAGEARNWFRDENKQGKEFVEIQNNASKVLYVSATPWHSPMEIGYAQKLGLWKPGEFESWIKDNFAHEMIGDKVVAKLDPAKQAKLRQQLIERGQFVSQTVPYDGFTGHFGIVPVTDDLRRDLNRIHEGVARAKSQLTLSGKKAMADRLSAFEATYTKAFLERSRIPEATELIKKAREQGWNVLVFSETSSEDLFRRPVNGEPGAYRKLDEQMGGQLSRIIPPFPDVYDDLKKVFGEDIVDYSGTGNTDAEREAAKNGFLSGEKPIMYTTYAAGGIGVSLHDTVGDKPRLSVFLGPPYSGVLLEQAMGRTWRFGTKSDARAVFLATDSEPDIRLMATKIGPRMRAVRASVLGERDSLGQVMSTYSTEDKLRERQDMLAYDQGNEVKIDAQSFQRKASRTVGIDNWASINFPAAREAMNKGMQIPMSGKDGDWVTMYQDSPRRRGPMKAPPTLAELAARKAIDPVAESIAKGTGLPPGDPMADIPPADREAIAGGSAAFGATQSEIPADRDNAKAGKMAAEAVYKKGWTYDPESKIWSRDGEVPRVPEGVGDAQEDKKVDLGMLYQGFWNMETQVKAIADKAGNKAAGKELVIKNRDFVQAQDGVKADLHNMLAEIQTDTGLNFSDPKTMNDIFDVIKGTRVVSDPKINRAAEQIADLNELAHEMMAEAGVEIETSNGKPLPYSQHQKNRNYMPQIIDWQAQIEDPGTGEVHTLKEIMGKTFSEQARSRIIADIAEKTGKHPIEVLDELRKMRKKKVYGNVQRPRTIDFPFYKKDVKAYTGYLDQVAGAIAQAKVFGANNEKLNETIAKIPSQNGQTSIRALFDVHNQRPDWDTKWGRIYSFMANWEALTKMNFSAVKVPFHLGNVPMALGGRTMPLVKALGQSVFDHKNFVENATMAGTVIHQMDPFMLNDSRAGLAQKIFKYTGFNKMYRYDRMVAGATARTYMEQYALHDLKKSGSAAEEARRMLKERFVIGDQAIDDAVARGSWDRESIEKGMRAFTSYAMFSENNPLQMPEWARMGGETIGQGNLAKAGRMAYMLQSFLVKTHSLVRESVYDEMRAGNYKPLAYLLLATPVLGQMLKGMSSAATSAPARIYQGVTGEKHEKDRLDRWLDQFRALYGDHPAISALELYVDGIASQVAFETMRSMADPLLTAAGGDAKKAHTALDYLISDLEEGVMGPAWTSLTVNMAKLLTQEEEAHIGKPDSRERNEKNAFLRWLNNEIPTTKVVGITPPPKPKKAPAHRGL